MVVKKINLIQSFKTYLKTKKHPEIFLLTIITVILSGIGFCIDYRNIQEYGCVDLRNRVVGARLLNTEYSPYFFKWREGISDKLLDPSDNPNEKINRVTVPPSILILQSLITGLDYRAIKKIWFLFQYLCLVYILFTFMIMSKSFLKKNWIIIVGLLFIGGTPSWRLHVERGHIYIMHFFFVLLINYINRQLNLMS